MDARGIKKGMTVWIPCEVKGGPFPNERRVYVKTDKSEWFGFVNTSELRKGIEEGPDSVRAVVIDTDSKQLVLAIRGQSPASGPVLAERSLITNDSIQV